MNLEARTIDILGSKWTIRFAQPKSEKDLEDGVGGITDVTSKEIVVVDVSNDENPPRDVEASYRRVMRHEIIHTFLYESGLWEDAHSSYGAWPMNEEMIDFFAIQHEKIHAAFKDAGALDSEAVLKSASECVKDALYRLNHSFAKCDPNVKKESFASNVQEEQYGTKQET